MMKRLLAFVFLLLLLSPASCLCQNKHALVIGIGRYEDSRWGVIHGDVDVVYIVNMLEENGFADQEIKTLKNEEATKQAIVESFHSLRDQCSPGDKVYIHFSGHGQQVSDLDKDETENDGWDEAWIPYDAQPVASDSYNGEKHLIDDELNQLLLDIREKVGPSGRILVTVDACHSGGSTRDLGSVQRGIDQKFIIRGTPTEHPRPPLKEEPWITISACQPNQVNFEMDNPAMGKLSWCLYSLRDSLGKKSNEDLKKAIIKKMRPFPGSLGQKPMMTGCHDTESVKDVFN